MVSFVGFWIFVNATGYMEDDGNFTRFFCFLSLFAASMLGLVISNNLLCCSCAGKLVGLCSYLLIGFWYFKPAAAGGDEEGVYHHAHGDVGFFLGILMLYWKTGTLNLYAADGTGALQQAGSLAHLAGWWGLSAASTIAFLLFIGRWAKSAQFPLHVWLPDAMEVPTPVSALIHAATMVAAGVVFMVGPHVPALYGGTGRLGDGFRNVDRLFHSGLFCDNCRGAVRRQASSCLFDLLATWFHDDGAGRRQPCGRTVPPPDSCVLQSAAFSGLRLR